MAWDTIFYATAEGTVPGADFLDGCPAKVRGTILAVLDAVAAALGAAHSAERSPVARARIALAKAMKLKSGAGSWIGDAGSAAAVMKHAAS